MVFNSYAFGIFLPVVFLLYWFVGDRWLPSTCRYQLKVQNAIVVVASFVFYGWWDWHFLALIIFTAVCSFASGILIRRMHSRSGAKAVLWANIIVNLLVLCVYKYYDFFAGELVKAFGVSDAILLRLVLPVGISFYTFQALSYSIDVYMKRLAPARDVVEFFAYVCFFPQLVAGPIERATNLLPQFHRRRVFDYALAVDGLRQILWGLFLKVVIADNCALYVDDVWRAYADYSGSTLIFSAILFTVQIYCDFAGYSDIAIGTAKLFGIRLMPNFNAPYFSRDIAEFWRRWHISLTTWFRDYVYIPMGGSRCSKAKIVRNTFVIFLLSGLWHGANWTFLLWGAYHAALFLPLILLGHNRRYTSTVALGRQLPTIREVLQMTTTFALVLLGWIIFRAPDVSSVFSYIGAIFTNGLMALPWARAHTWYIPLFVCLFVMLMLLWYNRDREHALSWLAGKSRLSQLAVYYPLTALILYYAAKGNSESFIYFQF